MTVFTRLFAALCFILASTPRSGADDAPLVDALAGYNNPSSVRIGQGAGAGLKGAREEVVEGLIAREIGILGFAHIHAVSGDEPADQRSRRPTAPRIRNAPRKPGQPLFGKEMLGQDEKTITHGLFNAKPGMMCRSVCCGWLRGN